MATRLTIANAALADLGEDLLQFATPQAAAEFTSGALIDPEDDIQARVAAIYPQVRSKMLAAHPWSWLSERASLRAVPAAQGEDKTAWPYTYRYAVPNPFVGSIRAVYDRVEQQSESIARTNGWDVKGAYLYASFSPAFIESQVDTAEEAWPDLFTNAVTLLLTARLAMSIKEDLPTMNAYLREAKEALADAMRVDAQSHPVQVVQHFEWVESRVNDTFGYGYGVR